MHIVVVPASKVSNPDAYINALVAYWQSDEYFGKWGLPKNAIAVVLGVSDDASTISWARAKIGNAGFLGGYRSALSYLEDTARIHRPFLQRIPVHVQPR
jgi:hypothetical protein